MRLFFNNNQKKGNLYLDSYIPLFTTISHDNQTVGVIQYMNMDGVALISEQNT